MAAFSDDLSRRDFVKRGSLAGTAALGGLAFAAKLPRVSAAEAAGAGRQIAAVSEQVQPLVVLIEQTSRGQLLEKVAEKIRAGTSYQEVLAALLLAGVRNVQPRPSVGFKFHCVLVVNSCHLASVAGPDEDRWLPIFWALDYFKSSQADEARQSGWQLPPVKESQVPSASQARQAFIDAMESWDPEQADAATAALVRHAGANELFNLYAQYAARDYRSIGHKVIYLANAWRTLQVIGWEFAEPVLRSLTFALLNHSGEPNPADSDLEADRPWRQNAELMSQVPSDWKGGTDDSPAANDLLAAFRSGTPEAAARQSVDLLRRDVAPQTVWDGVFVGAGELLMRQPGIIGLHGLTTANAMHYVWQHAADDELRKRLLLQACSFNPMFRESAKGRGSLSDATVQSLEQAAISRQEGESVTGPEAIEQILAAISGNRMQAAQLVAAYVTSGGDVPSLVDATRRMIFLKGRNAHDYKFSSAVLEDYRHVSPAWRDVFLATSVFNLKGSGDPQSPLVERTRAALG